MDELLDPEFDFSQLNAVNLRKMGNVTLDELVWVYKNARSRTYDIPETPREFGYHYCVGFSSKSRCFFIALDCKDGRYRFLHVRLADENEIEKYWCAGKK